MRPTELGKVHNSAKTDIINDVDALGELKKGIDNLVDSGITGPTAWRKAVDLGKKYSPVIRHEMRFIAQRNADERALLKDEKFGTNESESMRQTLGIPETIWYLLKAADPHIDDVSERPKLTKRLWDTFPEFRVAEKR